MPGKLKNMIFSHRFISLKQYITCARRPFFRKISLIANVISDIGFIQRLNKQEINIVSSIIFF